MKPELEFSMDTDLFQSWQEELRRRWEMRSFKLNPADMVLNVADEVELLFRAWFFCGRSYDFFVALFHNLQRMPVLKWLTSAPRPLLEGFFEFVPWYVIMYRPHPVELQFLISMYREDLAAWYPVIVNSLDQECCQHLMSRTANAQLRQLLRTAIQALQQEKREARFGLSEHRLQDSALTGLYGNKNQRLLEALDLIQSGGRGRFQDPYGPDYFTHSLRVAEAVFDSGLVADSLAILLDNYEDYLEKNRLVDLFEDTQIFKRFAYLLRKVTPVYAVLEHAPAAAAAYQEIYRRHFMRFSADAAAYHSLAMMDRLLSFGLHSKEAVRAALKLWQFNLQQEGADESAALFNTAGQLDFSVLQRLVDNRKHAQPQEAFMLLLLALWLHEKGDFRLDTGQAGWLFSLCQDFWTWVPSQVFFNTRIWGLLGPLLSAENRQAGDRLLSGIEALQETTLQSDLKNRPDLFRKKNRLTARQIMAGAFLGVH
ncbi:MAG: hypothetical protein ACOX0F_06595 [Syntrophomonadaceae bacterium]